MEFESHHSIAVLSFSLPALYPRITRRVLAELGALLTMVRGESPFRGVVIASNSESFATGADIEEIAGLGGVTGRDFARAGQGLFTQIQCFPLPVVAAIRGYCLGGGLDLALACHARVATYDASFGHPGALLGLITGWGGTQRLPRLVGKLAALQVLLTADRIPATQALTLGLVEELVSPQDLLAIAVRRAKRIASPRHW